jgi:hypothetical protein
MKRTQYRRVLPLLVAGTLLGCGGSTSQAPTVPATIPTPVPAITPTPGPNLGANSCSLGPGHGIGTDCPHTQAELGTQVNQAIDKALAEHPELFNFSGATPQVLDHDRYIQAVVANLNAQPGVCAKDDGEEIGVKNTNAFNEQWNIWFSRGFVRRTYVTTCFPAAF